MQWHLYIVECSDGSLYTGITTDIQRRIKEHNIGKGAKSLLGKRPVILIYTEDFNTNREAMRRETEIKRWPRVKKLELVGKRSII